MELDDRELLRLLLLNQSPNKLAMLPPPAGRSWSRNTRWAACLVGAAAAGAATGPCRFCTVTETNSASYPASCLHDLAGKGAFGVVRLALDKKTGQMYACKSISKARTEGGAAAGGVQPAAAASAAGCCLLGPAAAAACLGYASIGAAAALPALHC